MRRSALSVSANIAEVFGRHHVSDKLNFYYDARGSLYETQSHIVYAQKVKYVSEELGQDFHHLVDKITVDIGKLISSLSAMKGK